MFQFQYFLQVAEGDNEQFRAAGTTGSVCPFVPFVRSAEQAMLSAKDEPLVLSNGKDLFLTPHFFHPLFFLCLSREYGPALFHQCPVICGDTGYHSAGQRV